MIIIFILIFIVFLSSLSAIFENYINKLGIEKENYREYENDIPMKSDVAGSDLYAEKINAFVAGNKSIIKQSLFTNDTNILSQFDSNDPAFYKCNIILSASNGINPDIFPRIMTESEITSQYSVGFNNFAGFLYYDHDVDLEDAKLRANRALEIIQRKFKIDLIMLNTTEPNFFPFIGSCPDWECYFYELTTNFPMDGYWKALDINRLTSHNYLQNNHLSLSFFLLNSLDFFDGDFDITTDQVNFNLDSLDLAFLENLELENLFEQFDAIIENYGDLVNATISEDELKQFIDIFSAFTLRNNSHYTSISIQYEGLPEGITKIGKNQYKFNLWDALGYTGAPLAPSEKIYIALTGAILSNIEINILCTDVINSTPMNFKLDDYLLEQLALLFYYAGVDFDIETLKDYSFDLFWVSEEGIKHSYIKPVNTQDPSDVINLIQQFGFQGLPFILTGIINPLQELSITYNLSKSEPSLLLKKELIGENASYGAFHNFSYYISAENVGNSTAWGVPSPLPLELDTFLTILSPWAADNLKSDIWNQIQRVYPNQYNSIEDFFNFDEDPRLFYFDTFGTGIYDTFYPNPFNFTNLWPYNKDANIIITEVYNDNPGYFALPISTVKELLTNEHSVWNDENWRLKPGGIISYQVDNVSLSNIDSFSPFYRNNFSIEISPKTPEVISGVNLDGTNPEMALLNDKDKWVIGSVEKFLEQKIEINFIFKNDTVIDFVNNTLEMVSIIINLSTPDNLDSLDFKIFNFENEEFLDMSSYLDSTINNTLTFSFVNTNNTDLDWLFYPLEPENYIMLFKIICTNSVEFNISINDVDIEFSTRNINYNDDSGSRVVFSSPTSYVQYEMQSNSVPLNTYDGASIIATSIVNSFNSNPGDLITYFITFKNIGSDFAKNISISLLIPGIIDNLNEFKIENNNLTYYFPKLAPSQEKTINFTFYAPNSISISDVSILYNNAENIEGGNSSRLTIFTNEVFISAPIDYINLIPFVRTIEINYSNSINNAPTIGEIFNLTISIINKGPFGFKIPDINISMNDQFGDLKRKDNSSLHFEDFDFNEIITFNITLKKIGWKGYYYPPINFIESSESKAIQIYSSLSIVLGTINFTIIKSVDKNQIEIGDVITVYIEVENTGTIAIENVKINDIISYSSSDFSLIEGKLINLIESLNPGEKVTFNYSIRGIRQAFINLNPASIKFYYFNEKVVISNSINVKIINPNLRWYAYILVPLLIVSIILISYYWQFKKYKKKKRQFQRSEMNIFELSSREAVLKIEHTLRDRLSYLANKSKKDNVNFDSIDSINNSINNNE